MKKRHKTPHEAPVDDGVKLIENLQHQCESLRAWQTGEAAKLQQRAQQLDAQSQELEEIRTGLEADEVAQNEARRTLQEARETLGQERQAFTAQQQKQIAESARLNDLKTRVEQEQAELTTLRAELDSEWTNISRIRRANEKLADELDTERSRLRQSGGPGLKLNKAA